MSSSTSHAAAPGAGTFGRPRLVTSRCLEVDACRYDGRVIPSSWVRRLEPHVEMVPVCPEVGIGLGVPRDPIRLVRIEARTHLVQPATGLDVTGPMEAFATGFLDDVGPVDGFLLKSRSPSCGIDGVKVYDAVEDRRPADRAPGLFARAVLDRHPGTPVEHEARLEDHRVRDHFFTALFALEELRRVRAAGSVGALVAFQARHKLTLMARSPRAQRELGRIVANPEGRSVGQLVADYEPAFRRALALEPGPGRHVNVIQHVGGYFRDALDAGEKRHFLHLQQEYGEGRIGRTVLLDLLRSWVLRSGQEYLAGQAYLWPYPGELMDPADPGNGGVP